MNVGLLFKLLKPGIDPLGPDNVLLLSTGPVAGTLAPSSARYNVSAKSPLTGFLGDSNSGGHWSSELRYAGYDGIVIHGRSDKSVYLLIEDDDVRLLDASDIWGRDTWETTDIIQERHDAPQLKVACIGIAGENLVKFACIVNDYGRAAGRTGMGAVMGSKKLKAIAVKGSKGIRVAQPKRFYRASERLRDMIRKSRQFEMYHVSGVIGHHGVEDYNPDVPMLGLAGFKYQSTNVFPGFAKIGGKEWWRTHWTKIKACSACQMHCSHFYIVRTGPFAGIMSEGIDAEAMAWVTAHVGGDSKDVAAYAYTLLNRFGIDSNEMGAAIGALMIMYEKGIVTDSKLKELKARWLRPNWGDPETILSLIEMTAKREGIGDLLAEGPYHAAKKIGGGAEYWVVQNKGMSVGGGDRRPQKGGLLNHMVSNRGPDHLRGSPSLEFYGYTGDKRIREDWVKYIGEPELFEPACQLTSYIGKAPLVIWQEHLRCLSDSFGLCSFNYGNWPNTFIYPEDFAELYSAATGIEYSGEDMVRTAQRIINVEKSFNIREGWTREDDQPPERWIKEAQPTGGTKGERVHLDKFNIMLDEYYRRRGWDEKSGLPHKETLEELDLADVANELERIGKLAPIP
jgi:aldehyde:ferredoxin oxidoreductase